MLNHSFGYYGVAFFGIILARYFLVAGGMYFFFYLKSNGKLLPPIPNPSWASIQKDISLSVISAAVFAIASALVISSYSNHLTRIYTNYEYYSVWYLGVSYIAVLVLQDAYFYFTHRLFHHPLLFAWLHKGHHHSRHPTPWTSFAFDPLEAIVSSIFLIGIVFIMPLHFITIIALLITMTIWAVLNHLGIERFSVSFPHHWLGKWFIGPAHHSIHHLKYNLHYGLYFTFWDNFCNTQDPKYVEKFKEKL